MSADNTVAWPGLTLAAAKRRLKLGAISPGVMEVQRDGEMCPEPRIGIRHPDEEPVCSGPSEGKSQNMIGAASPCWNIWGDGSRASQSTRLGLPQPLCPSR